MMPYHHDSDAPWLYFVKNVVGKIRKICPSHDASKRREMQWILKSLTHRSQEIVEKTIRQLRSGLALVVVEDLPDIPDREPVVNQLHTDRSKALRNSS
jgi:hypothetical protein